MFWMEWDRVLTVFFIYLNELNLKLEVVLIE